MLPGWLAVSSGIAYVLALLALGRYGDRTAERLNQPTVRKFVYALTICVFGASWCFFDTVGFASNRGIDFLPFYIGPIIVFALFYPFIVRMIRLAKAQRITSIADFVAVRYGKSALVAATVTIIAIFAYIPFLAVQLQAVAQSLSIFIDGRVPAPGEAGGHGVVAAGAAAVLAAVTILLGTRRLDATEHHRGMMLAVAATSIVKFVAFCGVGAFVCWEIFHGLGDLTEQVISDATLAGIINARPHPSFWLATIVLTSAAVVFMPRQFHVTVVENRDESDVLTAAWFVPAYFTGLTLFVMPLTAAGLILFPEGTIDRALTVLALPIHANAPLVTLVGFLGSLSAAIGTFLMATMALAVMSSNDIVIPILVRLKGNPQKRLPSVPPILLIRRGVILLIVATAWLVAATTKSSFLTTIGFYSMICAIQVGPVAIGGLLWTRGTARGAIWGPIAGVGVWAYTLLLPTISADTSALVIDGPLGFDMLRPTALFGLVFAPFEQGLAWSLAANVVVYVALSLSRPTNAYERLQANVFVRKKTMSLATSFRLLPFNVGVEELLTTVSRYLGPNHAIRLFRDYYAMREQPFDKRGEADAQLMIYAEQLIASAIGAASARTVTSSLLERQEISKKAALRIVDDVAFEIQSSRDILQHAIDVARDGMAIYDRDLRLVAWNRAYRDMFQLPPELLHVGVPLDALVRANAERGMYGQGAIEDFVASRLETLTRPTEGLRLHGAPLGRVLEMRSIRLHNGGLFFTYTDATEQVRSETKLEAENVTLEQRVRERTEELENLNFALARAKAEADDANISKTRFLAAASHDLLQPLNAARLYTTSMRERLRAGATNEETTHLAANVDTSLEAVEDILSALLEISHLDAGATKAEIGVVGLQDIFQQLMIEFEPMARERGIGLRLLATSLHVNSDRRLLRRLLQNLISNAVKYTLKGRVLVGARRIGAEVRIDVFDTGIGIPAFRQHTIFREFERLQSAVKAAPGAGLGLSIVERLSRILKHEVRLTSVENQGSRFSVVLPRAEPRTASELKALPRSLVQQRSLEGLVVAAIDNEAPILAAMEMLLRGWDCVVASGKSLKEIETSLEREALVPDVIVADYHIDEVDGLGVISALRERYGPRPAVLITADRSEQVREMANEIFVRVLNKPVKPAALRSLLSQWRLVKVAAE